jgi:hypothetical protein
MRITQNDIDQYQLNKHILNRAFLSTSIDRQVAEIFAGVGQQSQMRYTHQDYSPLQYSCVCQYLIKQKSTAIDIQNLSTRPDEKEILIIPFTVFKVIAIKYNYLDDSTASISIEIQLEECEDSNEDKNQLESTFYAFPHMFSTKISFSILFVKFSGNQTSLPLDDHVIKHTKEYVKLEERNCLLYGIIGLFILAIVGSVIFVVILIILTEFNENYAQFLDGTTFPLAIFGILTSIITIIVLQKKNFRTSTNLILQHVAFFKAVVLILFDTILLYFYILHQPNTFIIQSKVWPCFFIFLCDIGLTGAYYIALWLTCLLSIVSVIK